ncbi:MAG: acylphosphatase [Spirochaetales bacterium]|nr:acylphosphatase [Spirochaetales bacterium]
MAVIHGAVQGVGFRYYARSTAQRLGVRGYVQNLADGNVKIVCEGSEKAVGAMEHWLRSGPPSARVTRVDLQPYEPTGGYPTFTVEF